MNPVQNISVIHIIISWSVYSKQYIIKYLHILTSTYNQIFMTYYSHSPIFYVFKVFIDIFIRNDICQKGTLVIDVIIVPNSQILLSIRNSCPRIYPITNHVLSHSQHTSTYTTGRFLGAQFCKVIAGVNFIHKLVKSQKSTRMYFKFHEMKP